jgi:hypothetical protein
MNFREIKCRKILEKHVFFQERLLGIAILCALNAQVNTRQLMLV